MRLNDLGYFRLRVLYIEFDRDNTDAKQVADRACFC